MTEQQLQSYQLTQGYVTLHRLQVHHLTLNFIIHNQYNYVNTLSASEASHSLWCSMINRAIYYIWPMSDRTYVSNTHAHVRMSL